MDNLIPTFISDNYQKNILRGSFCGTALFADISGFTAITEALTDHGREGAEILSRTINSIFAPCINEIHIREGFIINFIGDALLAVFPTGPYNALSASIAVLNEFKKQHRKSLRYGTFIFSVKIGLSHGTIEWGILGNDRKKRYYFKGQAIDGSALSEHQCNEMEIVIDNGLHTMMSKRIETQELSSGFHILLRTASKEIPRTIPPVRPRNEKVLETFLPDILYRNKPVDELREAVSIFVSFRDVDNSHSLLNAFITDIMEITDKYGGYFNKITFGDKGGTLLINFGTPVSYEKNIQRSLSCIIEIRNIHKTRIRAGITLGRLFSGIVGSSLQAAFDVQGDAVNLSARIAMKAEWGGIWMPEDLSLSANKYYITEYIDEFALKGKSKPVRLYRLKQETLAPQTYERNFYGRDSEKKRLSDHISNMLKAKSLSAVYIYGEAGSGKSRLCYEVLNNENTPSHTLHCDSILRQAWNPFIGCLTRYFGLDGHENESSKEQSFEHRLNILIKEIMGTEDNRNAGIAQELKRTACFTRAALGLNPQSDLYWSLDAKQKYLNTIYGISEIFKAFSIINPVIILIEDIQWIDHESVELLSYFSRTAADFPVMLIFTARSIEDSNKPIKGDKITLESISDTAVFDLVREMLFQKPDDGLFAFIREKTSDNPYYIEQLCLFLKENDLILSKKDSIGLAKSPEDIPARLNQVLIARIDRLEREIKETLKIASVLGKRFQTKIFYECIDTLNNLIKTSHETSSFDIYAIQKIFESDRLSYLQKAEQLNLLKYSDNLSFMFTQGALHETAYELQLRERLRLLHKIVAENIKKQSPSSYVELAHHYSKAELIQKAIFYLKKAGDHLKSEYKNEDALDSYQRLINLTSDNNTVIETRLKMCAIYIHSGKLDRAEKISMECIDHSENTKDLAEAYNYYAITQMSKGNYEKAREYFEKAIRVSEEHGHKNTLGTSFDKIGLICYYTGRYQDALQYFEKAEQIFQSIGHTEHLTNLTGHIGIIYFCLGDFNRSLECFIKQREIAEAINSKLGVANATGNAGIAYFYQGQWSKALENYETQRAICEEIGDKQGIANVTGNIGNIYYSQFKPLKALGYYQQQLKTAEELGNKRLMGTALRNIGVIYLETGKSSKALGFFFQCIKIAEEIGDQEGKGTAIGNIGIVYFDLEEYDIAMHYFTKQLKIFEALQDKRNIAYASGNIAKVYFSKNDHDNAYLFYEKTIDIYNDLKIIDNAYIEHLLDQVKCLLHKNDLPKALTLNKKAEELAEGTKNKDLMFRAKLQDILIRNIHDKASCLKHLNDLLSEKPSQEHQAMLYYEIYSISRMEQHKTKVIKILTEIQKKSPKPAYRKILNQLEKDPDI